MQPRRILACSLPALFLSFASAAQHHDHAAMHGSDHGAAAPVVAGAGLSAGGDAVFEAIAEVVALLESDPDTDWSTVDLDALRTHLLDMQALFGRAMVEREEIPGGARFVVRGDSRGDAAALDAARRMVPAHARMLEAERGWRISARVEDDIVVLEVSGEDEAAAQRIRGLGFFGLMASGEHHRPHHLAIARGTMRHQ